MRFILNLSRWFLVKTKVSKWSFGNCVQKYLIFQMPQLFSTPKGGTIVFVWCTNAPTCFATHPSNWFIWIPELLNYQSVCGRYRFSALFWWNFAICFKIDIYVWKIYNTAYISRNKNKLNFSAHTFDCQVVTDKMWKFHKDWIKADQALLFWICWCTPFLLLEKTAFKDLAVYVIVFTFLTHPIPEYMKCN